MDKRAVFCAGWAGAMQATDLSSPEELGQAYIRWLEKEEEGVDPLALMLDGAALWPNEPDARFGSSNVANLEVPSVGSAMRFQTEKPEVAEVAQAIFELEANADAWLHGGVLVKNGDLALRAWDAAPVNPASADGIATRYLEAAARLRDGWRPQ